MGWRGVSKPVSTLLGLARAVRALGGGQRGWLTPLWASVLIPLTTPAVQCSPEPIACRPAHPLLPKILRVSDLPVRS